MLKKDYELIKTKYGHYASWAIWSEGNYETSKEIETIVCDISMFEVGSNPEILNLVKPEFVFVGLNISTAIVERKLSNFHGNVGAHHVTLRNVIKIRDAFEGTQYYGGYMTDVIKSFNESVSGKMMSHLKNNKSFEQENIKVFEAELADLGIENKIIFAFGGDVYKILSRNGLAQKYNIVKLPHYSHLISINNYKQRVRGILAGL